MIRIKKSLKIFCFISIATLLFCTQSIGVLAQSTDGLRAIFSDTPYFDANSAEECIGQSSATSSTKLTSGKVYVLGDSITESAKAKYVEVFGQSEITATVNASANRKIDGPGNDGDSGLEAIEKDKATISDPGTKAIVVALGTNGGTTASNISAVITKLRALSSARIYWVDTIVINRDDILERIKNANVAIDNEAKNNTNNPITPISWFKTVDPASDPLNPTGNEKDLNGYIVDADVHVHPTSAGVVALVDLVSNTVINNASPSSQTVVTGGCSCSADSASSLEGNDNYEKTWNYLAKKGLTPNAIAGVMGNLHAESGINPQNMQAGTPNRIEPEMPTQLDSAGNPQPLNSIYGSYGYGIVQWTVKSRQLSFLYTSFGGGAAPFDKPRSTGDLSYQLDYMWSELESTYFDDVLTVLQDPSVTIDAASDYFAIHYEAPRSIGGIGAPKPPAPPETPDEKAARIAQNAINKQKALEGRRGFSADMLQRFQNSTQEPPLSDCGQIDAAAGGALGGNGKVDAATGYAFPLEPQTRAVGGITVNQLNSRHGGKGPAFDLFGLKGREGGDDIYAFDDGEIAGVGEDEPGWCYNIQLKAADGFYYWYGHLNNVVVKRGDRVRAGQVMGEIAEWTPEHNCEGSSGAAHLHIDRGCTINGVPQTGGRDECRDAAFIPLLSEIYGRL